MPLVDLFGRRSSYIVIHIVIATNLGYSSVFDTSCLEATVSSNCCSPATNVDDEVQQNNTSALPVDFWIQFKRVGLICKALHSLTSLYLLTRFSSICLLIMGEIVECSFSERYRSRTWRSCISAVVHRLWKSLFLVILLPYTSHLSKGNQNHIALKSFCH